MIDFSSTRLVVALTLLFTIAPGIGQRCLGQTDAPSVSQPAPAASTDSSFEELPELKASEILKPEFLHGPHHTVRESVPTFSGSNQFIIESDFGIFDADGNEMLVHRVKEVYAIAQLSEVSRTDQFKKTLC